MDIHDDAAGETARRSNTLPPRPVDELLRLPASALLTIEEASSITRISVVALAQRRSIGAWPRFQRCGRLIRYRLGDVLEMPPERDLRGERLAEEAAQRVAA